MRHVPTLTLLVLFALVAGLQAADDKPARHVEKEGGYSLVPPAMWELKEIPGLKFKGIVGPAANNFASNLVFVDEAFKGDLGDYVTANKNSLARAFKKYKELDETESKTKDGQPYIRLVTESEHNDMKMRQTFYFLDLKGDKKLVISCTALADGGDKLDPIFEACIKTFQRENK